MRILTPTNATEHGITRSQLQGPRFRRLFHGVYVDAHVAPTLDVLVAAARVAVPDATVTGVTALRLRGASVGADSPIWLATPSRVGRKGIVTVNSIHLPASRVATLLDSLRDANLKLVDEVVTLDELRSKNLIRRTEADELAVRRPHTWGLSVANSGSVRESRTRMLIHTAGLPTPRRQYWVPRTDGSTVGRVDFAWPEYKVVLEYEGQQHLTNAKQWESDIKRYEELERLGWIVIRVTATGLLDPIDVVCRVESALRTRGWRGSPPQLGAAWLAEVS
ncbi:endonuclease domain-containing protein [Propionibacteriaceae bacterium G1746]